MLLHWQLDRTPLRDQLSTGCPSHTVNISYVSDFRPIFLFWSTTISHSLFLLSNWATVPPPVKVAHLSRSRCTSLLHMNLHRGYPAPFQASSFERVYSKFLSDGLFEWVSNWTNSPVQKNLLVCRSMPGCVSIGSVHTNVDRDGKLRNCSYGKVYLGQSDHQWSGLYQISTHIIDYRVNCWWYGW